MGYQFVKFYPFLSHFLSVKMSKKRVGLVRRQRRRAHKALLRFLQGAPCAMARRRLIPHTLPCPCQKGGHPDVPGWVGLLRRTGAGGGPVNRGGRRCGSPLPAGRPAPCFEGKPSQNTKTKGHPFGMSLRFFGTARGARGPLLRTARAKRLFPIPAAGSAPVREKSGRGLK